MAGIPFVRDLKFAYGEVDQVSPLIRRVIAENPGPFTFLGTGVYIIGRGEVAVIDPGPPIDAHLEALKRALAGERVTHVFTTHTHMDHSPLAHPLAQWAGCKVYGTPDPPGTQEHPSLEEDGESGFMPDILVNDGDVFTGPGWTLEAITTPGHMSNHVCYALREENALFSGDHIMGWNTTVIAPPEGHMGDYYASLERLLRRRDKLYLAGHGESIAQPQRLAKAYMLHRRWREEAILDCVRKGATTIDAIRRSVYRGLDGPIAYAASLSALAHVEHLETSWSCEFE